MENLAGKYIKQIDFLLKEIKALSTLEEEFDVGGISFIVEEGESPKVHKACNTTQ